MRTRRRHRWRSLVQLMACAGAVAATACNGAPERTPAAAPAVEPRPEAPSSAREPTPRVAIDTRAGARPTGPRLLYVGGWFEDDRFTLRSVPFRRPGTCDRRRTPRDGTPPWRARLLDAEGRTLDDRAMMIAGIDPSGVRYRGMLDGCLDDHPNARRLEVWAEDEVVAALDASPSAPEVHFVVPAPDDRGAVLPGKLRWALFDADGDLVGVRVSVSTDGQRWHEVIASTFPAVRGVGFWDFEYFPVARLPWAHMPDTGVLYVEIEASDGFHSSYARTGPLRTADHAR